MDYLNNDLNIIHRDLKAANIFLVENRNNIEIKIGDFGYSLNKLKPVVKNYYMGSLSWIVILILFLYSGVSVFVP